MTKSRHIESHCGAVNDLKLVRALSIGKRTLFVPRKCTFKNKTVEKFNHIIPETDPLYCVGVQSKKAVSSTTAAAGHIIFKIERLVDTALSIIPGPTSTPVAPTVKLTTNKV